MTKLLSDITFKAKKIIASLIHVISIQKGEINESGNVNK